MAAVTDKRMLAWINDALASLDHAPALRVEAFRDMPWALVATVETASGRLWFKANHSAFSYEAALLSELAGVVGDDVLSPMAVAAEVGWFLAADGGAVASEATTSPEEVVRLYAQVQVRSQMLVDGLVGLGVPDRRPAALLDVFDRAVASEHAIDVRDRCLRNRRRFEHACEVLADDGRVAVVDGDVKFEHVFVGPPLKLFDWADSVISHPYANLGGLGSMFESADAVELRGAFLDEWGGSPDEPAVAAAITTGRLLRADIWLRDPPGALDLYPGRVARHLNAMADALESHL